MGEAPDFFVSYTSADRAWAEWIAWQLEAEGYQVVVQAWDFCPGRDWIHEMQPANRVHASRLCRLLSRTIEANRSCSKKNSLNPNVPSNTLVA
jgi:hypothetical protein